MLNGKQSLEHILVANKRVPEKPSITGAGFNVYKDIKIKDKTVNIISFENNDTYVIQENRKTHYITVGSYLLTLSSHNDEPDIIDLKYTHLYRLKDGFKCNTNLTGKFYSGCLIVIDKKILAVCCSASYPQFIAIINDTLTLLPCLVAEQIIRNFILSEKQLKSLIKMYNDQGWELHNGIAINPETMSTPSSLQVSNWKRRTRTKSLNIDSKISSYYSVFLRKEKKENPCVKYIRSSDF